MSRLERNVFPVLEHKREIAERGYDGGISQLKAWLAPLKQGTPDPVLRFETPPGQQMQADFTWVRKGRDPLVAFVATPGYSRASDVKFGRREDLEALRPACGSRSITSVACHSMSCSTTRRPW